jgi:hypothetical protein
MLLIVTNRQDLTADFLILELKNRKADYIRFNTEDFPNNVFLSWRISSGLVDGYLTFPKRRIYLNEITSIWYRRPISPVPSSEILNQEAQDFVIEESRAALEGLWRTLTCFWVSNPDNIRVAENKLYQLRIAAQEGFNVWPTMVTSDASSAYSFYYEHQGDVVYKPLKKGRLTKEGELSLIFTNLIDVDAAKEFGNVKYTPSLLQKYIHKSIELRATVIGQRVFTVAIESQNTPDAIHDWRRGQSNLPHRSFDLPADLESKCKNLVKKLGLEFGAIDLILTPDNEYVFVEINPNGQWAWIQQLCPEILLRETLADLLIRGNPS